MNKIKAISSYIYFLVIVTYSSGLLGRNKDVYWLGSIKIDNKTGRITNLDLEYKKKDMTGNSESGSHASLTINPGETETIYLGRGVSGHPFQQVGYEEFLNKIVAKTLEDYNASGTIFGPFNKNEKYTLSLSSEENPIIVWKDSDERIISAEK